MEKEKVTSLLKIRIENTVLFLICIIFAISCFQGKTSNFFCGLGWILWGIWLIIEYKLRSYILWFAKQLEELKEMFEEINNIKK